LVQLKQELDEPLLHPIELEHLRDRMAPTLRHRIESEGLKVSRMGPRMFYWAIED
jgi:hypothetical protein